MSHSATTSLAFAENLDQVMADVLEGKQRIVSYPQTSQYGPGGIGAAACGFAALNCARIVFHLEERLLAQYGGRRDYVEELLRATLSYDTTEEIVSICSSWKSSKHLEVEDLLDIPVFKNTFDLARLKYGQSNFRGFQGLIKDVIAVETGSVVAAVVTRSPEILVCLKIPTNSAKNSFFVVFDSHPRQNHPLGSGMIVCSSMDATAAYLAETLGVDSDISNDAGNYQAMLLGQFSGHILVAKSHDDAISLDALLMKASVDVLNMKGDLAEVKQRETELWSQNQELLSKVYLLEHQLQMARSQSQSGSSKKNKNKRHDHRDHVYPTSRDAELSREIMAHNTMKSSPSISTTPNKEFPPLNNTVASRGDSSSSGGPYYHQSHSNAIAGPATFKSDSFRSINDPDLASQMLAAQMQYDFDQEHQAMVSHALPRKKDEPPEEWLTQKKQKKPNYADAVSKQAPYQTMNNSQGRPIKKNFPQQWLPRAKQQKATSFENAAKPPNTGQLPRQGPSSSNQDEAPSSEILAIRMQLQFEREDKKLALETAALQEQFPVFECLVCMDSTLEEEMVKFSDCDHAYCRQCLRQYISTALSQRQYPISCPKCVADKLRLPSAVDNSIFEIVGLADEDLAIFQEMELAAHSVPLLCRKCNKTMFVDRYELQGAGTITCPLPTCDHVWCKDCQQTVETVGTSHSCDGSAELDELLKKQGWRRCPGCKIPVQKVSGCNHMNCSYSGCNTHFCYLCGELIVQSKVAPEVSSAVGTHYAKCRMFEDV